MVGRTAWIIEERENPSSDYFILPLFNARGDRVVRCRLDQLPGANELEGVHLVVVRYLTPPWRRLIAAVRPRLASLSYFMDDDLFDLAALQGLPWRYRYKVWRLAWRQQGWLRQQQAGLWVSTPWLAERYAAWQPRQIDPAPLEGVTTVRLFYHGSASHQAELRWLRGWLGELLLAEEGLSLEIIADNATAARWRSLPRTTLVRPMAWGAYQHFLAQPGRAIGLAPLLAGRFNRARSCTKFYDIGRAGAVGLYSRQSLCCRCVHDGVDGLLLENNPAEWQAAVVALLRDTARRQQLQRAAAAAALTMRMA
jgi:hypothetical protein